MPRTIPGIAFITAILLLTTLAAFAQTSNWDIDPNHSTAQFTVRHLGISNVTGSFGKVSGNVVLNDKDISQSQVTASIDVTSVYTRVEMRDNDLKGPHFFDAAKYPTIDFKSKRLVTNGDHLQLLGDLTMHGVTREITLDSDGLTPEIAGPGGNPRRGFSATTSLNRKDFNITYGGAVVGDLVKIEINAEIVKKK